MTQIRLLIQVSRPIVWPVLPLVYSLGLQAGHVALNAVAVSQIILLTFPMNLIGCGLNDLYDIESDRRATRRRAIWGATIRAEERSFLFEACVAMMPVVIFGGCISRNWDNFVTTVSLVLVAWLYSVPPARLKERPPLDSLANGLGYFLLPFSMGYSLGADIRTIPTRYYFLTLCVCGVHALASAVDHDADRAAGHRTIAVIAGRRGAALFACATFVITWWFVEFQTPAVRFYVATCTLVTFIAAIVPRDRVIYSACVTIFCGFLIAAVFDIAG
jgi:4-hydroxybenzoate polyprenyltransferase